MKPKNNQISTTAILLFSLFSHTQSANNNAVTYTFSGGRFGDNAIAYLHAKWIAYKYNIPLFYQPFPYSDQLKLHDIEMPYDSTQKTLHPLTLKAGQSLDTFITPHHSNTLYVIPYFPESPEEYLPTAGPNGNFWTRPTNIFAHFPINWNESGFKKSIQHLFSPKHAINLITPPKDKISIAIQVRKNSGGFDLPFLHGRSDDEFDPKQIYVDVVFPLKHPPENYYIDQIRAITAMFPQEQFFVFIFTDDPEPPVILERFKESLPSNNIEFSCRRTENAHLSNVLEDLFSMTKFDCLIRPDSNLSIVASRLGDFKIIISPAHHHWEEKRLIIDRVHIEKNI